MKNKKIHFIGIKGIGMSALARLFAASKHKISGSDIAEYFHSETGLKKLKIAIKPFSAENINKDIDLVVYSTAYDENHPERKRARQLGIPQLDYGKALGFLFNQKKGIAVAGTHGKTTTTALIAHLLVEAGFDPSAVVGGIVNNWQDNSRLGRSDWFVAEADEYQEKFLALEPDYLVITNIDYDHSDWFKDKKSYARAFANFIKKIKPDGKLIMLLEKAQKFKKFIPKNILLFPQKQDLLVLKKSRLTLLGDHNKKNALLAIRLARELGIKKSAILSGLSTFRGTKRRMEFYPHTKTFGVGVNSKLIIADDYGHHPEEIKATLKAIKEKYPAYYMAAIFQPHTYTRTQKFMNEFAESFEDADAVILLPVYSSAREKVSAKEKNKINKTLFQKIKSEKTESFFANTKEAAKKIILGLKKEKKPLFILTIGAGDVWRIAEDLKRNLQTRQKK